MAMIALRIPQDISDKLADLSISAKKEAAEEYHVTMFYFEQELKINDIISLISDIYEITKRAESFKAVGKEIQTFPRGKDGIPVIIPIISEDLLNLRKKLASRLDKSGIKYSKKWPEYKPHLTLAYSTKDVDVKKIDAISWKVDCITLFAGDTMSSGIVVDVPLVSKKKASRYDGTSFWSDIFVKLARYM